MAIYRPFIVVHGVPDNPAVTNMKLFWWELRRG